MLYRRFYKEIYLLKVLNYGGSLVGTAEEILHDGYPRYCSYGVYFALLGVFLLIYRRTDSRITFLWYYSEEKD